MFRLRISSINRFLILVIVFFACGGMTLFVPVSNQNMNRDNLVIVFFAIMMFIITLYSNRNNKQYNFIKNYLLKYTIILVFFTFYTLLLYGYSLSDILKVSATYWYILLAPSILSVMLRDKSEKFIDALCYIGYFSILVRFISWLSVNYIGGNILVNYIYEYEGWTRNSFVRFVGGPLFYFAFFWTIYRWIDAKTRVQKYRYTALISFLVFYVMFVTQTRLGLCIMIVSVLWIYILMVKKNISKFLIVLFILISIVLLFVGGGLDSFFDSFSTNNIQYGMSTTARLDGVSHFFCLFKEKGHYIGLGFISNVLSQSLFVGNVISKLYIEDLGVLEGIYRFGIFYFAIIGSIVIKGYKLVKKSVHNGNKYKCMIIPLEVIFILLNLSANIFIKQYAISTPIFLALFSYAKIKIEDGER